MAELWDLGLLALVTGALAALLAGVSKAGFGSGVAAVATPMLTLVVEPALALGAMLPVLMSVDLAALKAYWRKWNGAEARRIIVGAVPGIALGALLHAVTDPDVGRVLIGSMALLFALNQLAKTRGWIRPSDRLMPASRGYLLGVVAGFTSFVSHSGGPPVLIYLLSRKLDKTEFVATTVLIFWAINLIKLPPYILLGFYDGRGVALILWLLPFALIGVSLGLRANRYLSERAFFAFSYVFLVFAGAKLIWDGLT